MVANSGKCSAGKNSFSIIVLQSSIRVWILAEWGSNGLICCLWLLLMKTKEDEWFPSFASARIQCYNWTDLSERLLIRSCQITKCVCCFKWSFNPAQPARMDETSLSFLLRHFKQVLVKQPRWSAEDNDRSTSYHSPLNVAVDQTCDGYTWWWRISNLSRPTFILYEFK